jgi:hypothetical protein
VQAVEAAKKHSDKRDHSSANSSLNVNAVQTSITPTEAELNVKRF